MGALRERERRYQVVLLLFFFFFVFGAKRRLWTTSICGRDAQFSRSSISLSNRICDSRTNIENSKQDSKSPFQFDIFPSQGLSTGSSWLAVMSEDHLLLSEERRESTLHYLEEKGAQEWLQSGSFIHTSCRSDCWHQSCLSHLWIWWKDWIPRWVQVMCI